jgi:iron only hydrogenase large subunit-like protein
MPCFDKKLEASRLDFFHEEGGVGGGFKEVDLVLTSVEVFQLIEQFATEQQLSPAEYLTTTRSHAGGSTFQSLGSSSLLSSSEEGSIEEGGTRETRQQSIESLLSSNM